IAEVDNEMATLRGAIDREFVREIASVQNDVIQCSPGNVSGSPGADCTGNSIALAVAEQSHPNALAALLDRYEEKLGQIQSPPMLKRKIELNRLLETINVIYDQRLRRLELERESRCQTLETAYSQLLQRRVLSATTPYIDFRRGPAKVTPLTGGMISRLVE